MVRSQLLALIRRAATSSDEPDADLLRRFVAEADPEAFGALAGRYARLVWTVCRNLLANDSDAEDAFQATFLALAKSATSVRDPDRLGPWLHSVAHRVCLNARRAAARRVRREKAAATPESGRPVPDSAWERAAAMLHEEIARLPEPLRVAVVLCCLEGNSVTAAAAKLGLPVGTFSARLGRGKQRLIDKLSARGVGAATTVGVTGAWLTPSAVAIERAATVGFKGATVPASVLSLIQGVTSMGMLRAKLTVLVLALVPMAVLVSPDAGSRGPQTHARPAKPDVPKGPKLDRHGDPLPDKAVLRLGTVKYRVPDLVGVGFKKSGELVAITSKLDLHTFPADGGSKATVTNLLEKPTEYTFIRVTISADARFAAARLPDKKKLVVWDISGAKPVEHLTRDMADTYTMAFSPDGRWLAVHDNDRNQALPVLLCDVANKKWQAFPLTPARGSYVEQFAFTADGKWLAATTSGETRVIETATGKFQTSVTIPRVNHRAAAVSPDGKTVAVAPSGWLFDAEPTVRFFTTDNGSDAQGLTGPTGHVTQMGYLRGAKTMWLSFSGTVREWDPVAGKWLREVTAPTEWRHPPVWSPDGKRFVTHNEKTLAFVDAKTWKPQHPESLAVGPIDTVFGVTVSPNGKVIATEGNVIHLWDAATGKLLGKTKSGWGNAPSMAFLPDSKTFIAVTERYIPIICDSRTGKELRRFKLPEELVKKVSLRDLRLSPDGKTLTTFAESASSDWKSYLLRWDVAKGEVTGQVEKDWNLLRNGFVTSPDGEWVAQLGKLTRAFGEDKEPITVLPREESGNYGGSWSPDSKRVALPRALGKTFAEKQKNVTMVVYDVTEKAKVTELTTGKVVRSAFSRDGKFLATMGNGQLAVWNVDGAKEVFRAACDTGNTIYARAIAFTPDGKRLVTGHETAALVWDVSSATGAK